MKIAIVVYSKTGNTKSVAEKVYDQIKTEHDVNLYELKHYPKKNENDAFEKPIFYDLPDLSEYKLVLFAAWVEAFSLVRVFQHYLKDLAPSDAKAIALTTQAFPKPILGGNRAQRKMQKLIEKKGYQFLGGSNVCWGKETGRQERIENTILTIVNLIE